MIIIVIIIIMKKCKYSINQEIVPIIYETKKEKEGKSVKAAVLHRSISIRAQASESTEHFLPEIALFHIYFLSALPAFHFF